MNIIHPATGQKALTIPDAQALLDQAMARYEGAWRVKRAADEAETTARKLLDVAQATFDAAVADLRAQAPGRSAWGRGCVTGDSV
jgi:hypothetical protein